ncbi:MAG: hypothetical protein SangKO_057070 [Sandaracinaceae bacterium]
MISGLRPSRHAQTNQIPTAAARSRQPRINGKQSAAPVATNAQTKPGPSIQLSTLGNAWAIGLSVASGSMPSWLKSSAADGRSCAKCTSR